MFVYNRKLKVNNCIFCSLFRNHLLPLVTVNQEKLTIVVILAKARFYV